MELERDNWNHHVTPGCVDNYLKLIFLRTWGKIFWLCGCTTQRTLSGKEIIIFVVDKGGVNLKKLAFLCKFCIFLGFLLCLDFYRNENQKIFLGLLLLFPLLAHIHPLIFVLFHSFLFTPLRIHHFLDPSRCQSDSRWTLPSASRTFQEFFPPEITKHSGKKETNEFPSQ